MLSAQKLSFKRESKTILEHIDVTLHPREILGVIGPNGAGKSTLLHVLLGLLPASSGNTVLNDMPLSSMTRRQIAQLVSFVPQDTHLHFDFTVKDIIRMGRQPHRKAFTGVTQQDEAQIQFALKTTDLMELADTPVTQLSGGERQRVFIARAIAQESNILLMDEPTANLDLNHQLSVMEWIKAFVALSESQPHGCIVAIHDINLAAQYCDRLLLLHQGKRVAYGSPKQVLTAHNLRQYFNIDAQVNWNNKGEVVLSNLTLP